MQKKENTQKFLLKVCLFCHSSGWFLDLHNTVYSFLFSMNYDPGTAVGTGDAKMEQYLGSTLTELSYHWSFNKNRLAFLITSEKQKRGIWSPLVQNKVRTVHGGETKRHKMRKSTEMTHFCSVVTENETVAVSWLPGNTSRYLNVGVSSKERLSLRTKHHPFSGSSF